MGWVHATQLFKNKIFIYHKIEVTISYWEIILFYSNVLWFGLLLMILSYIHHCMYIMCPRYIHLSSAYVPPHTCKDPLQVKSFFLWPLVIFCSLTTFLCILHMREFILLPSSAWLHSAYNMQFYLCGFKLHDYLFHSIV